MPLSPKRPRHRPRRVRADGVAFDDVAAGVGRERPRLDSDPLESVARDEVPLSRAAAADGVVGHAAQIYARTVRHSHAPGRIDSDVSKSSIILSTAEGAKRAKICLLFCVLRDLCGEEMGAEFMTIYLVALYDVTCGGTQNDAVVGSNGDATPFIPGDDIAGASRSSNPIAGGAVCKNHSIPPVTQHGCAVDVRADSVVFHHVPCGACPSDVNRYP